VSASPLQLGAVIPCDGLGRDPMVIRDFAQAAEDLGYDWIETFDHVLGAEHAGREPALPRLYDEHNSFHEPLVTLAYIAALTTRIGLATSVLVASQRQTALVAKQATQLQLLSANRLRLALGTGWNWVEYQALGMAWAPRGRRLEEQIHVLRLLFSEPCVTFHGEFHDIERAGLNPLAEVPVPIWLGGGVDVVFERAARLADGFVVPMWGESGRRQLRSMKEHLERHGRDVSAFPVEMILDGSLGPETLRAEAEAWSAAGGTHLTLRNDDATAHLFDIPRNGWTCPDDFIGGLESFAEAVR
jgi:probable F420-dependent oxidoreductase